MTADLKKKIFEICPTVVNVSAWNDEKKKAFEEKKPGVFEHLGKYEKFLKGDKFTDSGLTYGEIDLFATLNCCATGPFPEVATGGLKAFYERMIAHPGIKKVLDGESKFGKLELYMIPV